MRDCICRTHVSPRTKLFVPKVAFPIPLNYIELRQTKTTFDVLQEVTIDDYWNVDGSKSMSEPWLGVTRFALLNKNPPEGNMWVQRRLTNKQVNTRPGNIRPEEWSNMSESSQRKDTNKWAEEKHKWDAARERRGIYFIPKDDPDYEESVINARSSRLGKPQRCFAWSPNQTTRQVQAGGDLVQVIGLIGPRWKRKDPTLRVKRKIMRT